MRVFKIYLLGVFFLGTGLQILSQENISKELLEKVAIHYKQQSDYTIDMQYQMLRGFTGNIVTESYKGTIIKKGDVSKYKVLQSEVLQFGGQQLVIDHGQKLLMYNKVAKTADQMPISIDGFLESFEIEGVQEQGDVIQYQLKKKAGATAFPYNKIILKINKEKYQVVLQELFFANKLPFNDTTSKNVPDNARLRITMNHKESIDKKLPKLEAYIQADKNGKIQPTAAYKMYQFIDQTQNN